MIGIWRRSTGRHPLLSDAALALLCLALSFAGAMIRPSGASPLAWWYAMVPAAVACATVPWRRGRPRAVVVVTTACAVAVTALGYLPSVLLVAPLIVSLYSLAARTDARTTTAFTAPSVALVVVTGLVAGPTAESLVLKTIAPATWLLLPVAIGSATRLYRSYLETERARAEFAERTREQEARRRVAAERMRIARELHDVMAHHIALANAQANAAEYLMRTDPRQAHEIIAQLTGTTSAALRELKATVGLMREADQPDPLEPAPGLERLPDLAASFEAIGLAVDLVTEGEPQVLSSGTDLTAYRIVQEALTNVSKHSAAGAARVRLAFGHNRLSVTVTDDGPATSGSASAGYGLVRMRERTQAVGGRLRTGPRPDGGFEVVAELPVSAQADPGTHP
jgi:signal transduction histidine kinase